MTDQLETLRSGARTILLGLYRSILKRDGWPAPDAPVGDNIPRETQVGPGYSAEVRSEARDPRGEIVEFEKALHKTAILEFRQRKAADFRLVYCELLKKAQAILGKRWGSFPDESLAYLLWCGRVSPAEAAAIDSLQKADADEDPRDVCRMMFLSTLLQDDRFRANRARALECARQIESACFNYAVTRGKMSETLYRRHWDSQPFIDTYSVHCGTINVHLDPRSTVATAYHTMMLDRLWSGELKPDVLGLMEASEMCPDALRHEREELAVRSQQKLTEKSSNMFKCPHCGQRACKYKEVQRRALDEPADFDCTCLNPECGREFKGRY